MGLRNPWHYRETIETVDGNSYRVGQQFASRTHNHGHQFESGRHFRRNGDGESQQFGRMRMGFRRAINNEPLRNHLEHASKRIILH